ncbi:MAG: response regulator [Chloroflexi bacterium]|nr:response regulator [Ktedonobacteraceae bacterium]MBV9020798.1 response regulator [Ktedonobacteraceae bacterium]MBV9706830.1 response regulator [Chloroflexota bacterium]
MAYNNSHASVKERTTHKTILVVEDDNSIGDLLVDVLSQETPYKAVLVSDGFQALKAVTTMKPSLFITDYQLPYMDGIELYDRLRAKKELEDVPVLLISAYLPIREIQKRKLTSMSKPFELDDLLDTVERLLA